MFAQSKRLTSERDISYQHVISIAHAPGGGRGRAAVFLCAGPLLYIRSLTSEQTNTDIGKRQNTARWQGGGLTACRFTAHMLAPLPRTCCAVGGGSPTCGLLGVRAPATAPCAHALQCQWVRSGAGKDSQTMRKPSCSQMLAAAARSAVTDQRPAWLEEQKLCR